MEKSNLFFTYLGKFNPQKENQKKDENNKQESIDKTKQASNTENEWFQEYEVIYQSYSIG
ncbi:MAG: hypothetical protein Q8M94_21690 [Ignavibacteria bacterium]|nr:hypothetical protein [Ignavibacteria bacterium]